jgi:hypothetical protein
MHFGIHVYSFYDVPPEKPPYHTAHVSSKTNILIGVTTVQKWSITPANPYFLGLGRFHPQEKYPSRARKRIQENERASILYANHYVILPLLKILRALHPGMEFEVCPEHRLMTWIDPKTYKEADDGHDEVMDMMTMRSVPESELKYVLIR